MEVFGLLAKGTTSEELWARFSRKKNAVLQVTLEDLRLFSAHKLTEADAEARKVMDSLGELIQAVIDSRTTAAWLMRKLVKRLSHGTNRDELRQLLRAASDSALEGLPPQLARISGQVDADGSPEARKQLEDLVRWIGDTSRDILQRRAKKQEKAPFRSRATELLARVTSTWGPSATWAVGLVAVGLAAMVVLLWVFR